MLPTQYQEFIHVSRYARWFDHRGRRENWSETVGRYFDFFTPYLNENHDAGLTHAETDSLFWGVRDLEFMPSMRAMMTAGPALERDHIAGYNCAYTPITSSQSFSEIMYILMCGTGVGYSVERQYVNQLPEVPQTLKPTPSGVIDVEDSKQGWAEALQNLLWCLYSGYIPEWTTHRLRPAGAILHTMGGRSSGPEPLEELFRFIVGVFQKAVGRRLNSLECHDIVCKIGDIVVVGGVRRSALICLSNLSDDRMRGAKMGNWYDLEPQRMLANNSIAFTERPDVGVFMKEWQAIYESKSGERGLFNRNAAAMQAAKNGRRLPNDDWGTNPCSEIILRPMEFCNLSEPVAREKDTFEILSEKIRKATILGTWQACLTNFGFLNDTWAANCQEERLLGVSLTGIMDCEILRPGAYHLETLLEDLKQVAIDTNKEWAERLGIPQSAAITCVKPSGTVSQLVNSASGIHARHSAQYIRRVRQDKKDPLTRFMIDQKFPYEEDKFNPSAVVFEFPVAAPEGAILRDDLTAKDQLEHWLVVQDHWCEHKPSITVTVREKEWPSVGGWVWDNFDSMSGVSFLPHSDHVYVQAPYEDINVEQFAELEAKMPKDVDFGDLSVYESEDHTTGTQQLACIAGVCDI